MADGVGFGRPVRSENVGVSGDSWEARINVGVLTETMMRLRGEIGAWRHVRVALQADLVRQTDERRTRVSALCAVFARDRAGARRVWFGPTLSERRAAERQQQQQLAEEARAKVQAEEAMAKVQAEEARAKVQAEEARAKVQAEEARAKAQAEEARAKVQAEEARAKVQAGEARAKARGEQQPPATAKAEPQRHEPAKPVPAPAARPPVAPLPQAQRPPFKGSKKH